MTHVRHDLFGATLTTGESAAFDLIKALLAQPPQATADKVKEQAKGTHYKLTGIAGTLGQEWGLGDLEARLAALAPQVEALRGKTVGAYTERPSAASAAPAPAAGASKPTVSNW
jgi:hypothetical protein